MLKIKKLIKRRLTGDLNEIVRGASSAFLLKNVGTTISLIFNIVLARLLGAESSGLYYLAFSFTSIAVMISRFGLDNTLVRFSAAHASKQEWSMVKGLYYKAMSVSSLAAFLVTAVTCLLAPWVAHRIFSEPSLTIHIQLMAMAILPTSLLTLYAQLLIGIKKTRQAIAVQLVLPPAFTLIATVLLVPLWGLQGAIIGFGTGAIITLVIGFLWWRQASHEYLKEVRPDFTFNKLLQSSFPLFWQSLFLLIPRWIPVWLLGAWTTSKEVGIYNIANRTAFVISFILVAVNSISSPKFSEMYARGDLEGIGRTARGTALMMAFFSLPLLILMIVFPEAIMGLYGFEFRSGGWLLVIMALGQYVSTSSGSVQKVLMMCGYEHLMRNIAAGCAVIAIVLSVVLIPILGGIGAAIAFATTLTIQNLWATGAVHQKLGIWTLPITFFIQKRVHNVK